MNYIIKGAQQADGHRSDLYIAGGLLVDSPPSSAQVIQAEGLLVLPGLVDMHTHLREPGREDAETVFSGTRAAARGGYTAVCAMANTDPVTDTAERAEHVLGLSERDASCQVVPVGAVTKGLAGKELAELGLMARSRAGVRVFSDDGRCVMDAQLVRRAMEWIKPFNGVLAQHSQDSNLAGPDACCHEGEMSGRLGLGPWPPVAESVIIARDAQLAQATGSRLHVCHVTSAEGVEVIRWAKKRGIQITAEVTPHHLLLGVETLASYDTTFKVNPPLRSAEHVEALRQGLSDGTIDAIGTDHAPHASQDKDHAFVDALPGMIGLEQALAVLIETMLLPGRISWQKVAEVMSTVPARIAQIKGQGGQLKPGEAANLVLIDPSTRAVVDKDASASISRNNPYHGLDLPDPIVTTIWNGRITFAR